MAASDPKLLNKDSSETPKASAPAVPAKATTGDRALILGPVEDGAGLAVLRQRSESAPIEGGIVRPLRHGEPIAGEVVKLTPTEDASPLCNVEVQMDLRPTRKGPAQVATSEYRDGWNRVFGSKKELSGTDLN